MMRLSPNCVPRTASIEMNVSPAAAPSICGVRVLTDTFCVSAW